MPASRSSVASELDSVEAAGPWPPNHVAGVVSRERAPRGERGVVKESRRRGPIELRLDRRDVIAAGRTGVRPAVPQIDAGVQRACEPVARPCVDRRGVQLISRPVFLLRIGPETVIVHLGRSFVFRVDVEEGVGRAAESIHLQLAVDEKCAAQCAANGGAGGDRVVEQVGAPVTDAERLPLRRPGAREQQLPPVVPVAALDTFEQAAIQESIGPHDERTLPLGPQRRALQAPIQLDLSGARLWIRGWCRRRRLRVRSLAAWSVRQPAPLSWPAPVRVDRTGLRPAPRRASGTPPG